jgi:hypothetical protein
MATEIRRFSVTHKGEVFELLITREGPETHGMRLYGHGMILMLQEGSEPLFFDVCHSQGVQGHDMCRRQVFAGGTLWVIPATIPYTITSKEHVAFGGVTDESGLYYREISWDGTRKFQLHNRIL